MDGYVESEQVLHAHKRLSDWVFEYAYPPKTADTDMDTYVRECGQAFHRTKRCSKASDMSHMLGCNLSSLLCLYCVIDGKCHLNPIGW